MPGIAARIVSNSGKQSSVPFRINGGAVNYSGILQFFYYSFLFSSSILQPGDGQPVDIRVMLA
jgi:hypothetical protein